MSTETVATWTKDTGIPPPPDIAVSVAEAIDTASAKIEGDTWTPDSGIPPPPDYQPPAPVPQVAGQVPDPQSPTPVSPVVTPPQPTQEPTQEEREQQFNDILNEEAEKRGENGKYGARKPEEYEEFADAVAKRLGAESNPQFVAAVKDTLDAFDLAHDEDVAAKTPDGLKPNVLSAFQYSTKKRDERNQDGWLSRTVGQGIGGIAQVGHSIDRFNPFKSQKQWDFEDQLLSIETDPSRFTHPDQGFFSRNAQGALATLPKMGAAALAGGPAGVATVFGLPSAVSVEQGAKKRGASGAAALGAGVAAGALETVLFSKLPAKIIGQFGGEAAVSSTVKDVATRYALDTLKTGGILTVSALKSRLAEEGALWASGKAGKSAGELWKETIADLPDSLVQSAMMHSVGAVRGIASLPDNPSRTQFEKAGGPKGTSAEQRTEAVKAHREAMSRSSIDESPATIEELRQYQEYRAAALRKQAEAQTTQSQTTQPPEPKPVPEPEPVKRPEPVQPQQPTEPKPKKNPWKETGRQEPPTETASSPNGSTSTSGATHPRAGETFTMDAYPGSRFKILDDGRLLEMNSRRLMGTFDQLSKSHPAKDFKFDQKAKVEATERTEPKPPKPKTPAEMSGPELDAEIAKEQEAYEAKLKATLDPRSVEKFKKWQRQIADPETSESDRNKAFAQFDAFTQRYPRQAAALADIAGRGQYVRELYAAREQRIKEDQARRAEARQTQEQSAPKPTPKKPLLKLKGPWTATDEYQDVPEGQTLPPGLDIRLDMGTGKTQARKPQPEPVSEPEPIQKPTAEPEKPEWDFLPDQLKGPRVPIDHLRAVAQVLGIRRPLKKTENEREYLLRGIANHPSYTKQRQAAEKAAAELKRWSEQPKEEPNPEPESKPEPVSKPEQKPEQKPEPVEPKPVPEPEKEPPKEPEKQESETEKPFKLKRQREKKMTPEEGIRKYAQDNDLDPNILLSECENVHQAMKDEIAARKAAKAYAHKHTGISALDRFNVENKMQADYTYQGDNVTGKKLAGFDQYAKDVVGQYPEVFTEEARQDPSRAVWDLLSEPPIKDLRLDDPSVLKEAHAAAEYYSKQQKQGVMFHGLGDLPGQQDLFDADVGSGDPGFFSPFPALISVPANMDGIFANAVRQVRQLFGNTHMPELARANTDAHNAGFIHATSSSAAKPIVKDMLRSVLGGRWKDAKFREKVGDVLVANELLGLYDEKLSAGDAEGALRIADAHDLDALDSFVRSSMRDPEIKEILQRSWNTHVNKQLNKWWATVQRIAPDEADVPRGRYGNVRINLMSKERAAKWAKYGKDSSDMPSTGSASSYRNPDIKVDPYARHAHGTGDYSNDLEAMLTSVVGPRYAQATKIDFYDALVKADLAAYEPIGSRGKFTPPDGCKRMPLDVAIGPRSTRQAIWVRGDLVPEVRRVLNTDLRANPNALAQALTAIQVASGLDAVTHSYNMLRAVQNALGAKNVPADGLRKIPILGSLDAIQRLIQKHAECLQNRPEAIKREAELAKIGAYRPEYERGGAGARYLHKLDTAARLVLDEFYTNLVDRGWAEDTVEGRRDFINQLGVYNRRVMGDAEQWLRDKGISPFVVAGKAMNRLARKVVTADPGFKTTSASVAMQARALQISKLAMIPITASLVNYLLWGNASPIPGLKFGAIYTGKDKDGNDTQFSLAQFEGVARGLRLFGANAMLEGIRQGKNANQIIGNAVAECFQTLFHPYAGPAVSAVAKTLTGKQLDLRGRMEADRIPGGGWAQYKENARATMESQNPPAYYALRGLYRAAGGDVAKDWKDDAYSGFGRQAGGGLGITQVAQPRDAAEELAHQLVVDKLGRGMTAEEKDKQETKRKLLKTQREDKKTGAEARKAAVADEEISRTESQNIRKHAKMTDLAWNVTHLSTEDVERVWKEATTEQKIDIWRSIRGRLWKRQSSADKRRLHEMRDEYLKIKPS